MEDDDDDKNLLGSLGVTTVDSEAIEHEILSQVKNCVSGVSGQSCEELENDRDHKVLDPSSSNFAKLYQKLRAIEVEIRAVGSSIPEEKNEETGDDLNYRFEPGQFSTVGSSLHQELAKDRIRSLQRTKAQLQKEISQFKEQDSTGGFELGNLVDNLVKEGPNHKQKNKKVEKSNQNPKQHRKIVTYQEDLYFDAVLDAGSAGFVETEREELIRKGILTPFHKIKGFERRLQLPSTSKHHEHVEDSNDNLASSSIARVAQSLADIACHRPSTKLLDAKHLPIPDPPTRPFQRLRKPQKIPPTTEKKRKKGQNSRPSSHKKWRKVGIQKEEVPDGSDGVGNGSDYCEEKQNNSDSSNDEEQLCVVLEGGLKIPNSIFSNLFDYQKVGLQWLWELHCQKAGGIIGDEMGLGKTIQVISFLAALHYSEMYKPSIVVCPVTLLRQWKREVMKWYPLLDAEILHDSADCTPMARCSDSDYDSEVSMDDRMERLHTLKSKKRWDDMINRVEKSESGLLLTSYEQLRIHGEKLLDIEWGYAILDEGHRIRNPNADVTLVCKQLQTVHRIIMTGAPIQNKLSELWSLFDFVFPGKLGVLPVFETEFAVPITVGGYANATPLQVSTAYRCAVVLRDLIMPYLLRRMKADVHAQLPKKTEHVLFCSLTHEQRSVYRAFLASSEVEQIFDGSRNSLYGIDVMRKICNHPDLLERDYSYQNVDYGNPERSGKMRVVAQVLKVWKEHGHRVLLFTQTQQMLDILEGFLIKNAYSYRRMDGLTPVKHRMGLMDEFNNSLEIFVFILTTKVGGLGTNLTGADRVILYDPDWNPSTDMQARERAWRIGQKRDVTVYRLITRGTIEEKVYHRQIYKHFLTNKILKNPQQRRFFKAKDMKDLFTLQDEGDENATETSNIFGQLAGELSLNSNNDNDDQASPAHRTNPSEDDLQENTEHSNGSANEATNILKSLFDAQGIHSAINHDAILNAHDNSDKVRMEEQASRVAQRAAEALQESRLLRGRESFSLPTWTGRSGVAGAPSTVHRKFGSAVNVHLLGSSRQEGSSSAGAATGKALSSAELLTRVRARQEIAVCDAFEQELASSSSRENARVPEKAFTRPPNRLTVVQPEVMVRQLCSFMQQKGGEADSASITQHFKDRIQSKDLPLFKNLLKQIATLEKDAGNSRWVLKPDYLEQLI